MRLLCKLVKILHGLWLTAWPRRVFTTSKEAAGCMPSGCRLGALPVGKLRGEQPKSQGPENLRKRGKGQQQNLHVHRYASLHAVPPDTIIESPRALKCELPKERDVRAALLANRAAPLLVPTVGAAMQQNIVALKAELRGLRI